MKNNILYVSVIMLASLLFGACGSDDESNNKNNSTTYFSTEVAETPKWQVDWTSNDLCPDWQEPNSANFEKWSILLVQIEEALQSYMSYDDKMALYVGEELRGLASPAYVIAKDSDSDGLEHLFLMKVFGNESAQQVLNVTLKYYCSNLRQVFSRTAQISYSLDEDYGINTPLVPQFTLGSSKYPISGTINLTTIALMLKDIQPAQGDIVAAFVGDECRGVYEFDGQLLGSSSHMTVYERQMGETVTLKFYLASTKRIFTFTNTLQL